MNTSALRHAGERYALAAAFEAEVDSLIQPAESELRLTRLAAEIQRTSRRVNALEFVPFCSGHLSLSK